MVDRFRFMANRDLRFGPGVIHDLPELLPVASRILIVSGNHFQNSPSWKSLQAQLEDRIALAHIETTSGEPSPEIVDALVEIAKKKKVEAIIAIGGGSVLDTGKAVAAMACQTGSVEDYLEEVGTRFPSGATLPVYAVPTTAGTGSEATKNAVISRRGSSGFKKSLRHDAYVPAVAILDPELALGCPEDVTRACGMDAFCQLLESYVSSSASPITDDLATDGLSRFARVWPLVLRGDFDNLEVRGELAMAAYESGLCLANAGLGTVHGIAGPLGAYCNIPHGVACGKLLGPVFRKTVEILEADQGDRRALRKLGTIAALFGDDLPGLLDRLESWSESLPRLGSYGLDENGFSTTLAAASNKTHPAKLTAEDRESILRSIL